MYQTKDLYTKYIMNSYNPINFKSNKTKPKNQQTNLKKWQYLNTHFTEEM